MKPFKQIVFISDGLIDLPLMPVQKWASLQERGKYVMTITAQRTIKQNNLLHVLVEEFRRFQYHSQGETWEPDLAKSRFKQWCGFCYVIKHPIEGGGFFEEKLPKSSSGLGKKKFRSWMAYCKQKWFNDFGFESKTLMDKETREFLGI